MNNMSKCGVMKLAEVVRLLPPSCNVVRIKRLWHRQERGKVETVTLKTLSSIEHSIPVETNANDILIAAKAFRTEHGHVSHIVIMHI